MLSHDQIEAQIQQVLDTETTAMNLSDKLFRPGALFSQLAKNEDERKVISKSLLFQTALKRFLELQRIETGNLVGSS